MHLAGASRAALRGASRWHSLISNRCSQASKRSGSRSPRGCDARRLRGPLGSRPLPPGSSWRISCAMTREATDRDARQLTERVVIGRSSPAPRDPVASGLRVCATDLVVLQPMRDAGRWLFPNHPGLLRSNASTGFAGAFLQRPIFSSWTKPIFVQCLSAVRALRDWS